MSSHDIESFSSSVPSKTKNSRVKKLLGLSAIMLMAIAGVSTGYSKFASNAESNPPSRQLSEVERILRPDLTIGCIDNIPVQDRERLIGARCGAVTKYQSVWDVNYQWVVKPLLDEGRDVVLVLEFFSDKFVNLDDINGGAYDAAINLLIDQMMLDGNRPVYIRFMHEFNGNWYPWGTYRDGNSPEKFKTAFRHVAQIFKSRGSNAKIQLSYNCKNPFDDPSPMINWFPGEDVVDMILCSGYNFSGSDQWHQKFESFQEVFQRGYDQMSSLPGGKPLGVAETSSTNTGGDKVQWFRDAFAALNNNFPRVTQANFFLINKWDGNFDLNSDGERRVFGEMINTYGNK